MVDFGNFSSLDNFKNDAFVYFLIRPMRVTFQKNAFVRIENKCPQALFVKKNSTIQSVICQKSNAQSGHRSQVYAS